jgi:Zn-dependent protease with chaperone function
MIVMSSSNAAGTLAGLPLKAVYLVLLEWARAAELSSDRASALVVGDPLITCQMLMRIAGGALEGMSLDAFLAQAARYCRRRRHVVCPMVTGLGRGQPDGTPSP